MIRLILVLIAMTLPARADDLLLDQGRQVAGLWLFPSLSEPSRWRYVPATARVATDGDGAPLFGLTFYVGEEEAEGPDSADPSSITQATGGGLLHMVVEYATDPEQVEEAEDSLRALLEDETAFIAGPVLFDAGNYSVVTSVAEDARLLANRPAPLMEGDRTAITARLSAEEATLLIGTLRTPTPDFSVVFDMAFSGLSQAYDATMVVDWEKTKEAMTAGAGGSVYFIGADVELAIEEAMQTGGITLEVNGDDADMEALVAQVHDRALDMMFAPIEVEQVPEDERGGLLDAIGALIGGDGLAGSSNTTGFGLNASYRLKDLRSEGITRLSFNKRATLPRRALMTVNLGQVAALDGGAVRTVAAVDPATQLRRIFVALDGGLEAELGGFVNSVAVTMRKDHPGGRETIEQIVIRPEDAEDPLAVHGPLLYSNAEREGAASWLTYEVATDWSFQGGGRYRTDGRATDAAMISLTAPFHRHEVAIEGDAATLAEAGVRAVIVEVGADFFGDRQEARRILRPDPDHPVLDVTPISLTLPEGVWSYDWRITWMMRGAPPITASGTDDLGFLFVDELPPPP
ncbi:hypothetical protein [Roseobacter sp. HKCCA0434]|uniref:hypothetical protein n=1 Tax=Roseobacter sp. HKCCA0434 TaxID=3079297 RepID=UPI002905BA93|nr:hypothetical protein [Roseobacter sp. HKCCA0434]